MARRRRPVSEDAPSGPDRVVLYIRVSTDKQAENRLSLEEQELQMRDHCERQGWTVVGLYCDAGESGSTLQRPEFQKMLARCLDGTRSIDAVLVHSISRAFRNLLDQERTVLDLKSHGISTRSMTENIVARDGGKLMRLALGFANELKSHDAHVGTMRGMSATARLGFSNGGTAPFGYRSVAAETIGRTTKRKLEIDPVEADIVRLVFRLALEGDGSSGPMGVRNIVQHLNAAGYRTRKGGEFYHSTIHEMLLREAYTGDRSWNVFDKHGNQNPDREIVDYKVPEIIDREAYDAVQAQLGERQPTRRGPRLDSAPSLFGGIIHCGCCKRAMSPSSGTGRQGKIYHYYKCAGSINKGAGACRNKPVGRGLAEARVMSELVQWLTTPDRLAGILAALHDRKASKQESVIRRITQLQQEAAEAEKALQNVYAAIESGVLDPNEPSLQSRVRGLRDKRDLASAALERAKAILVEQPALDSQIVETFRRALVERLSDGPIEGRKAWLGAIVDAIVVEPGKIRVIGKNDNFEKNLRGHAAGRGPVRSSVRKWWAGPDSNRHRRCYEQRALTIELPARSSPSIAATRLARPQVAGIKQSLPTGGRLCLVRGSGWLHLAGQAAAETSRSPCCPPA